MHEQTPQPGAGATYRIRVRGEIDERWSSWFDGLRVSGDGTGGSVITGPLTDQAALHGVLARVRDLGLTLVSVEPASVAPPRPLAPPRPVADAPRPADTVARSPVLAIAGAILAGIVLALLAILGPVSNGTEPTVTGALLLAFGAGWWLMAVATARWSSQPQRWMLVPAAALGLTGATLVVARPDPAAMDLAGWIWPPTLAALAIWLLVQVRRRLRGRGRWLVVPLVATLLVVAIGGALATVAGPLAGAATPSTGRLVDVGGRSLYLECRGTGGPAVILQAGLGATAADWADVMDRVAGTTTVCAYDRAGHGWSGDAAGPQDADAIAADLHTLLERADVAGPYILVGHSTGGPYQEVFAARHPDEVAGLVLLDAQPADAFTALPDYPGFYDAYRVALTLAPSVARVGVGLLVGTPADPTGVRTVTAMRDEIRVLPDSLRQARELTTIGDRPLLVVAAGVGQQAGWSAAQERSLGLSTQHLLRVIPTATHESLVVGPEAAASAAAILDTVAAVGTGSRLH